MRLLTIFLFAGVFCVGCNRNTSTSDPVEESSTIQPAITDAELITPEAPFKNQPNEFCTVIRKLDISYYDPKKEVEDISVYPKKYCLLDVCLDAPSSNGNIINLGDEGDMITSSYELIYVFNTVEEAKQYAEKHNIIDVLFEE